MWIFDGEEWKEEGRSEREVRAEVTLPIFEEMLPELQVVEIPVTVPRPEYYVPQTQP